MKRFLLLLSLTLITPAFAPTGAPLAGELSIDVAHATPRARRARRRRARRRRRPRRRSVTPAYRRQRARWHKRAPSRMADRWLRRDPLPLIFRPVSVRRRFSLVPDENGRFDGQNLMLAKKAFRSRRTGEEREIHPRLLELVHRAVLRFGAPWVWIVSGYRPHARPTSRHYQGRAIDMVLPGVPDRRLARFLRRQGYVGVGVYPISQFVHLDVRQRSYFWEDRSGPGQATLERQTNFSDAWRGDRDADLRGEERVIDLEGASEGAETPADESAEAAETGPEAEREGETDADTEDS